MLQDMGLKVEIVEPYTKHRPLSAFTNGVDPEDVAEIERIGADLNEDQRAAMNVVEKDSEIHLNHWFVMVVGMKNEA
jgi:hypothetical protein